jgi:hypothetical protein
MTILRLGMASPCFLVIRMAGRKKLKRILLCNKECGHFDDLAKVCTIGLYFLCHLILNTHTIDGLDLFFVSVENPGDAEVKVVVTVYRLYNVRNGNKTNSVEIST